MVLFSEDHAELARGFHTVAYGSKTKLPSSFVLDGEVSFEAPNFLVEVGTVVWQGNTVSLHCFRSTSRALDARLLQNLEELKTATKEARAKSAVASRAWANDEDSVEAGPSPATKGKGRSYDNAPINVPGGPGYKGFGIAPPRSYTGGKDTPSNHKATPRLSSSTKLSHASSPSVPRSISTPSHLTKPYNRPSPATSRPAAPSALSHRPPLHPSVTTPNSAGTPRRSAVWAPFKPPGGTPTPKREGSATPRKTLGTAVGPAHQSVRKSLLADYNKAAERMKREEE